LTYLDPLKADCDDIACMLQVQENALPKSKIPEVFTSGIFRSLVVN